MADSFYGEAAQMRDRLNAVGPGFCLAKWLQVSIHLPTGRTHSCYHPPSRSIPLEELAENPSALHNTRHKMRQRKLMLEGGRPEECAYCWKVEDLPGGHLSDRHYRSAEAWAAEEFEEIRGLPWDFDVIPKYVEVNFNQACQFKCSYCSPQLSSAWMSEIRQHGHYPTTHGHNRLGWFAENGQIPIGPDEPNPYVEAFWKWWPDLYPRLRVFRMTGGEPLIDPNTFRVLEYASVHPNPALTLSLTSNLCPPEDQYARFLQATSALLRQRSIGHFLLYASIDSVGKQAEYIRNGLDFERFEKNIARFLEIPGTEISFILTFNNLSAPGLRRYLEWLLRLRKTYSTAKQRIHFDTPFLRAPEFMSLQILNAEWKSSLARDAAWAEGIYAAAPESPTGLAAMEIDKIKRALEWAAQEPAPAELSRRRADFHMFFSEHDRRRRTDFLAAFPEMAGFWNLCRDEAARFTPLP